MSTQSLTNIRRQGQKTFKASGLFTVPVNVHAVEVLLVGGGGGGAAAQFQTNSSAGGGGAGGQWLLSTVAVTPGTQIPVIVGAGGRGGTWSSANSGWGDVAVAGGDSMFAHVVALGGSGARTSANDWQNLRHGTGGAYDSTSTANHTGAGGGSAGCQPIEAWQARTTTNGSSAINGGNAAFVATMLLDARGGFAPANPNGGAYGGNSATNAATWNSYSYPQYKTAGGSGGFTGRGYSGGGGGGFARGTSYAATGTAMVGGFGFDGGGNGATWNSSSGVYFPAVAGIPNTGGGGGGGADNWSATNSTTRNGAAGGSGLVVVKWIEEF
jgi:hypothetical protein